MTKSIGISVDFDVTKVFDLLESNDPAVALEIKTLINEHFNSTKESWLVGGLFEYYLHSGGSVRCSEILCGISREPHDKFLIEKMLEGIRSPSKETRKQTLTFLGHVVAKQPSWLYKIAPHSSSSLFREITRMLKTETDVVVLMTGLLTVIMIIPTIPIYITPFISEIFDVFGRIATWTHTTHNIPKEHLLHLQVGLYSLFHRLYAMFPCNFLSYLRQNFGSGEKKTVLFHTIMPMLEKVKMHPALVTATRESEMITARWKSKEYHEVIAECSKISLDVYETSFPEEVTSTFSRLNSIDNKGDPQELSHPHSSCLTSGDTSGCGSGFFEPSILKFPPSSLVSQAMKTIDLNSLSSYIDDSAITAPPTPLSVTSSVGPPPLAMINKTTSPPETAMEATPENTPIKDRERFHFKLPPTSPAAMQLNFGPDRGKTYTPPVTTTPGNSVPSSPLPISVSSSSEFPLINTVSVTTGLGGYALARRDSIFDSNAPTLRRDSALFQRLQKVQIEQNSQALQQSSQSPSSQGESGSTNIVTTTLPVSSKPESIRRGSIPSPITIVQSSSPGGGNTHPGSEMEPSPATSDFLDRPVGGGGGGPLTPMLGAGSIPLFQNSSQGFIDPDLSLITLDEETPGVDECQPSTCPKGGLHMADHKQMMAFAKRVSRLRFHSQCGPGPEGINTSLAPSPGTSPSSNSSSGLTQFKSRIIKRSFSCPNIKKPIREEDFEESGESEEPKEVAESNQSQPSSTAATADSTHVIETLQEEEQPYEHLFQKILPTVLSPPVESRTLPSPHYLLDLCLSKAAALHNARAKLDEMSMLRGQVELLHGQLLFERHRRESHALRNRRLAGKCRKMQNMEEQNSKMTSEIHTLEKENVLLKKEVTIQRDNGLKKETQLQIIITDVEGKLESYRKQVSDFKDDKSQLEIKFARLQEQFIVLEKESDKKKADLFSLENEVKHLQRYLEMNSELRMAYEVSQKEILLLGELLRRHQEAIDPPIETQRYLREEMEDLRHTCEEEIRGLRLVIESKMSQCEVSIGMINDLEKKLAKRERIIIEQNKLLQDTVTEHQSQIEVYENKYESIKETNHRLELEILNLHHQLTLKNYMTRAGRRIASSPSNGEMSPTGNSDVESASSAAGYQISPERNTCFFGSPQFDLPSEQMKDLQLVLDQQSSTSGTRRNSAQDQNLHPSTSTAFGYKERGNRDTNFK